MSLNALAVSSAFCLVDSPQQKLYQQPKGYLLVHANSAGGCTHSAFIKQGSLRRFFVKLTISIQESCTLVTPEFLADLLYLIMIFNTMCGD